MEPRYFFVKASCETRAAVTKHFGCSRLIRMNAGLSCSILYVRPLQSQEKLSINNTFLFPATTQKESVSQIFERNSALSSNCSGTCCNPGDDSSRLS